MAGKLRCGHKTRQGKMLGTQGEGKVLTRVVLLFVGLIGAVGVSDLTLEVAMLLGLVSTETIPVCLSGTFKPRCVHGKSNDHV